MLARAQALDPFKTHDLSFLLPPSPAFALWLLPQLMTAAKN